MWGRAMLALVVVAGCTKSNPAKHCEDGTCIDPNYPFCDVSGAIGGESGSCIATACTADQFVECRGDVELRCNADGTNFNLTPCDRGCDAAAGGCRLCDPGETACTNGQVATCDASGTVMNKEACPLGCFETEPRCREIAPSNGLTTYFDMVPNPPDLDLEFGNFETDTGRVTNNGNDIQIPSFAVSAPANGIPLRVFVANNVNITQAGASSSSASGPGFVLLARGSITITGKLAAYPSAGASSALPGCSGGNGLIRSNCNYSSSAGGGGAFATNGAKGGDVPNNSEVGGSAGIANGNAQLIPLRGGCGGGGVNDNLDTDLGFHGGGGGAIQLVSRTRILVDGIIDVAGGGGQGDRYDQTNGFTLGGGGAGGAILLEAPVVELGPNAQVLAYGGDGAAACGQSGVICTTGGKGARVGIAATPA